MREGRGRRGKGGRGEGGGTGVGKRSNRYMYVGKVRRTVHLRMEESEEVKRQEVGMGKIRERRTTGRIVREERVGGR